MPRRHPATALALAALALCASGEPLGTVELETEIVTAAELATATNGLVPYIVDSAGNETAATIGTRNPSYSTVGPYSLASGLNVSATMTGAHAEGAYSLASAAYAHAEGNLTIANGAAAHAEGVQTYASGNYSHAAGRWARAGHNYAFVHNGDTQNRSGSNNYTSHGEGTFNINPLGGLDGFYIGETNLATYLSLVAPGPPVWDTATLGANPSVALAAAANTSYKRAGTGTLTLTAVTGLSSAPTYCVFAGFSALSLPAGTAVAGAGAFRSGKENHLTLWTDGATTFVNFLFAR